MQGSESGPARADGRVELHGFGGCSSRCVTGLSCRLGLALMSGAIGQEG
jgi:hypothetical protein